MQITHEIKSFHGGLDNNGTTLIKFHANKTSDLLHVKINIPSVSFE